MICLLLFLLLLVGHTDASTATNVVVINNNRCHDYKCSPRVCLSDGCSGCGCVDCRVDSHCNGGKPYCVRNTCVQCIANSNCASDGNCDASCDGNTCVQHSPLNCLTDNSTRNSFGQFRHCLINSRICVECLSDGHCSTSKPYCDTSTYRCEKCLTDIQCRYQENCNAKCNTAVPGNHLCYNVNSTVANCTLVNQLCYRYEGACFDKCSNDTSCHNLFVDKQSCRLTDQRCVGCLNDDQCGISLNDTCGKSCSYIQSQDQTLCSGGTTCLGDKPYCTLFADHRYRCSLAHTLYANLYIALVLVCIVVFLYF